MLVSVELPPGVWRNGTILQSRGRWYGSNLVRWTEGTLRPMGGWIDRTSAMSGIARAMITWISNDGTRRCVIGTHTKAYYMARSGVLTDITISGMTTGSADASVFTGYGGGSYGEGYYGTPRLDSGTVVDATMWSLDTFGEYVFGVHPSDGRLLTWDNNTANDMTAVSGAPTSNRAVVATQERFLMVLGADGNPRLVKWADQESSSLWTADATNQAGDFPLQTVGRIMCGVNVQGGTLIFTDQDVHIAQYLGPPLVYGFERVGNECGIVSGAAYAATDSFCAWMGRGGFYLYDGRVQPITCDVGDYVFSDINWTQISKVWAIHNPAFGEIMWFYPSAATTEINRYVMWNYRENHWAVGTLARTCGVSQGVYAVPLMVGTDGICYEHESGYNYDDAEVYAESGPFEVLKGERVMLVSQMIPDEQTVGESEATFYARLYPTASEETFGPYTMANPTDFTFTAREVRMRISGAILGDWRAGLPKLEVVAAGKR